MDLKDISQKEVLRYLGYGNHCADETITKLISECIIEILNHCHSNHIYKRFHCIVKTYQNVKKLYFLLLH